MAKSVKTGPLGPFPNVSVPVFSVSAALIVAFIVFGGLFSDLAKLVFTSAQNFVADYFGWYLMLITNVCLGLSIYLICSRYGDVRLGKQTEKPEYGIVSWTAMMFSAGIGIGLLYWGTAEPLQHFAEPPIAAPLSAEAAKQAMDISFLHWGLHGWSVYAIVGLTLAFFHYRNGLPLSIRSCLYPMIGGRIYGPIGHTVDILAVFGTMFGVVTSLGLGVLQLNSGLEILLGVPNSLFVQLILIVVITCFATLSVMVGLDGGIKRISTYNIYLSFLLLGFMVVFGPTLFIFDSFVENIGNYAQSLIQLGTWTESYTDADWQATWTLFYWAWWISWSPFVGIFIARISRGRTVRQFMLGVLFIPTSILLFWFTAFGGAAVRRELLGGRTLVEAAQQDYGTAVFRLLEFYPLTDIVTLVVLVMIVVWFVTSSDSASFVIDMLTAGGDADPPKIQRLFWATTEGLIAAVLLTAGGLGALQSAAIVAGFPFSIVLVFMIYGLLRGLGRDKLVLYRYDQWYRTEQEAEKNSPTPFIDEHHLAGPPRIASGG